MATIHFMSKAPILIAELIRFGLMRRIALQTAVAVAAISAVACAQAASIQEIFEKYNLVGIFAQDCTKPATVQSPRNGAPQNWWFVNRLIDANHAQRDFMEGPGARSFVIIIDKAVELKPNEIRVTGMRDDTIAVDNVWHIEPNRTRTWQGIGDTKGQVADGKHVQTGNEMPWLTRCGSAAQQYLTQAAAPPPSHSSGFPVFTQFNLDAINGESYGDRPRTLNVNLAGNGIPYAVGFAGCHGWVGQIRNLDRQQIKFESIDLTQGQPQGPCSPAQQKAEDDFLNALKQASRWQFNVPTLILSWDGGTMRMIKP
jgi:heat shock protein HslJ